MDTLVCLSLFSDLLNLSVRLFRLVKQIKKQRYHRNLRKMGGGTDIRNVCKRVISSEGERNDCVCVYVYIYVPPYLCVRLH